MASAEDVVVRDAGSRLTTPAKRLRSLAGVVETTGHAREPEPHPSGGRGERFVEARPQLRSKGVEIEDYLALGVNDGTSLVEGYFQVQRKQRQ